jgi:hypothetical protein
MPVLMGGEGVDDWDQSVCFISGRVDTAHRVWGSKHTSPIDVLGLEGRNELARVLALTLY